MNPKYEQFLKSTVKQAVEKRKTLIEKFGEPAFETRSGGLTLNEQFWAAYYAAQRGKIIFEHDEKRFYDYDSATGIFLPKSVDAIRTELGALLLKGAEWSGYSGLQLFTNEKHLRGVIMHLRGQVEARDFFNPPDHFVHLGNCTLKFAADGSGFSVKGFSPDQRSRNRSPINYEPDADCPDFKHRMLAHLREDDQLVLQKYGGQCLLGRNLMQRFVILDGIGGSSKSSFIEVIIGLIGQKNVTELRTKLLGERFEIGRMIGCTLLTGADVQSHFLSEQGASYIKSLTGGDLLEAEIKNSNARFHVPGNFNILVSANTRLHMRLSGDRKAWQRRIIVVRYDKSYEGQRIFEIGKRLLEKEASGILNWCLEGLRLLFQDYAAESDIILSADQKKRIEALLSESESLALFVRTCISPERVLDQNGNGNSPTRSSITSEEANNKYYEFCQAMGWRPQPASMVKKQLPDLMNLYFGVSQSHDLQREGTRRRGWWNVGFITSPVSDGAKRPGGILP